MEAQNLFRESLVTGEQESGRTRSRVTQIDQVEQRCHVGFQCAPSSKRFSEVEDEVGLVLRKLGEDRFNLVIDREPRGLMSSFPERGIELIQYGIDGRLECVLSMQQSDLHPERLLRFDIDCV